MHSEAHESLASANLAAQKEITLTVFRYTFLPSSSSVPIIANLLLRIP